LKPFNLCPVCLRKLFHYLQSEPEVNLRGILLNQLHFLRSIWNPNFTRDIAQLQEMVSEPFTEESVFESSQQSCGGTNSKDEKRRSEEKVEFVQIEMRTFESDESNSSRCSQIQIIDHTTT